MSQTRLAQTAHYRIVEEKNQTRIIGENDSKTLLQKDYVHPLAYAIAFYADAYSESNRGFPSEMAAWARMETSMFKTCRTWLRNEGLLDNRDMPAPELIELGQYMLPLIRNCKPGLGKH